MWQIVINGPGYFDTPYDLPEGVTTLGRAEENDIVLSGDLVSRRHARFHVKGDGLQVEDLGSRNGSKLNGQALTGMIAVKAGDVVNVGENTLTVRQPAQVENAATQLVDVGAGNVRFFGHGADIGGAVLLSKNIQESVILRALDNIAPFDMQSNPFADDAAPSPEQEKTPRPVQMGSLFLLYKTAELLATSQSLQAFLEASIDRFIERVQAPTAVVLVRHSSGVLVPAAVRHGAKLARGEVPVSDAIVNECLKKGTSLLVADVRDDKRFRERESVVMYGADQVLCVPLGREQPFKGVLYLNLRGNEKQQLEQILDLATAMAHLITSALEKYSATDNGAGNDRLRRTLERNFPPEQADKRIAELKGGRATKMEERQSTLLYAEIAGLNRWLQGARPEQTVELLNDFYQRFTGIVFSFDGAVANTAGDHALAIFASPQPKNDDALRAVRAALALKADWDRHMSRRAEIDRLHVRLSLSTGKVMVGTVGIDARIDFTAVGDPVTVASLLVSLAEPGQVLITGKTLALIGARFDVNPLGEKTLRPGLKTPVFDVIEEDMAQLTSPGIVGPLKA